MTTEQGHSDTRTPKTLLDNYRRSRDACPDASRFVFDHLIGQTQAALDVLLEEERRSMLLRVAMTSPRAHNNRAVMLGTSADHIAVSSAGAGS